MSIDPALAAYVLAASDRADQELALRLEAWRDGWRACQQHLGDRYEAGYHDGLMADKRIQHAIYQEIKNYLAMWGGLRWNYGNPRPTDKQPATRRTGAAA